MTPETGPDLVALARPVRSAAGPRPATAALYRLMRWRGPGSTAPAVLFVAPFGDVPRAGARTRICRTSWPIRRIDSTRSAGSFCCNHAAPCSTGPRPTGRGLIMTSDGLRLLQDPRRSLLEPPRQLRPRSTTGQPTEQPGNCQHRRPNLIMKLGPTPADFHRESGATLVRSRIGTWRVDVPMPGRWTSPSPKGCQPRRRRAVLACVGPRRPWHVIPTASPAERNVVRYRASVRSGTFRAGHGSLWRLGRSLRQGVTSVVGVTLPVR